MGAEEGRGKKRAMRNLNAQEYNGRQGQGIERKGEGAAVRKVSNGGKCAFAGDRSEGIVFNVRSGVRMDESGYVNTCLEILAGVPSEAVR